MKRVFVSHIREMRKGDTFQDVFYLRDVRRAEKRSGRGCYLAMELLDRTGAVDAKLWSGADRAWNSISAGHRYAWVRGTVGEYRGSMDVALQEVVPADEPSDVSDYIVSSALDADTLWRRLDAHKASLLDCHLHEVLSRFFDDIAFREKFDRTPAAIRNHHACRGGLLQHSVEVADIAAGIADAQATWGYRPVNRDLVVTAALLHDAGKVHELEGERDYQYTRGGYLFGHILTGHDMVCQMIDRIPAFPDLLGTLLLHCLLAHHGRLEHGSPVVPMLPEAQIVHAADMLDAQLYAMTTAAESSREEFAWTRGLDNRRIFTKGWSSRPNPP